MFQSSLLGARQVPHRPLAERTCALNAEQGGDGPVVAREFHLFAEPDAEPLPLSMDPCLESWDAASHPSQVSLQRYLDHVAVLTGPVLTEASDSAAVILSVGLPAGIPLTTGGRDLDNYLCPVVRRLGAAEVTAAFACKTHGLSSIGVGTPLPRSADDLLEWNSCSVAATASTQSRLWKEQIAAEIPTDGMGTGPIEMHIAFVIGPGRNWVTLWKPAIDALGGILGLDNPARPFHPRDDRIVRLGLHRRVDATMGWDVLLGVWWRTAPSQ